MKLLVDGFDYNEIDTEVITEDSDAPKRYYIKGVFAQAETKNRNGRNYPKSAMENALTSYSKLITEKRATGELNHPEQPNVNLERASHIIESLDWDGNNIMGKARILTKLPMGKIAAGLLDEGVKVGVSTRGLGSLVENNGQKVVQDDYMMTAIDIVGDPSAPDAFVQGIMEGREWVLDSASNSWVLAEEIKTLVKKTPTKHLEEAKARAFAYFLRNLK